MQPSPAVATPTFPQPCEKLHVICGKLPLYLWKTGYKICAPRSLALPGFSEMTVATRDFSD